MSSDELSIENMERGCPYFCDKVHHLQAMMDPQQLCIAEKWRDYMHDCGRGFYITDAWVSLILGHSKLHTVPKRTFDSWQILDGLGLYLGSFDPFRNFERKNSP